MRKYLVADSVEARDYQVFLRQGDLDGACVFYSLMMCLNLCGYADDDVQFADEPGRRTLLGRLHRQFEDFPALFTGGADIKEAGEKIGKVYGDRLSVIYHGLRGEEALEFAIGHLRKGHPLILGLKGYNLDHAVTAVGLEFSSARTRGVQPANILVLDPGGKKVFCLWNSVIRCTQDTGRDSFPYRWLETAYENCKPVNVDIAEALAVYR